jgi:DNA-binding HxlR family transcriptional regulator
LKDLESSGVIASRNYAEHPPRLEYFLTAKGRDLGPVLLALKKWGEKHA